MRSPPRKICCFLAAQKQQMAAAFPSPSQSSFTQPGELCRLQESSMQQNISTACCHCGCIKGCFMQPLSEQSSVRRQSACGMQADRLLLW